ncbi:MAG: sulfotransferase [Pseudomonadota bacterium]|nr:sulfotransferase [Pseudomonadota bacterium]
MKLVLKDQLKKADKYANTLQKRHPKSATLLNTIGTLKVKLGKKGLGINYFNDALNLAPEYFEALFNLGSVLQSSQRYQEACTILNRASKIYPKSSMVWFELGKVYLQINSTECAISCFIKCLNIEPSHVEALNRLGIVFSQLGDSKRAETYFRKILTIDPKHSIAHRHLSLVMKYDNTNGHLKVLEDLLNSKLGAKDEIHIRHAHFKAMNDLQQYDIAFKSLKKANELKKNLSNYQPNWHVQLIKSVKNYYLEALRDQKKTFDHLTSEMPQLVFVLGMPRSGTTLVEQILSSHSSVFGAGEIKVLGNHLYKFFYNINKTNKTKPNTLNKEELYRSYHDLINTLKPSRPLVVDKMPTNFFWLGIIDSLFPSSRIINVQREPMAVIWSNYKHYFSAKELNYSSNLNDILTVYNGYVEIMEFWKKKLNLAIYDLNYEKLTINTEQEIRNLLTFLDLKWQPKCLEFHKPKRIIKTASRDQVRQPIYQGSSGQWKNYSFHLTEIQDELKLLQEKWILAKAS